MSRRNLFALSGAIYALLEPVSAWGEYFIFFQLCRDLLGSHARKRHFIDALDNGCRLCVDDPMLGVLRVFGVAVRRRA